MSECMLQHGIVSERMLQHGLYVWACMYATPVCTVALIVRTVDASWSSKKLRAHMTASGQNL
jgi:hypothetical protein